MRPARALLHRAGTLGPETDLRAVASASFVPRGSLYDPRLHLRRRAIAIRGGARALVVALGWHSPRGSEPGRVRLKVLARDACSSDEVEHAITIARGLTAVDDDPTEFLASVRDHAVLGPLVRGADPRLSSTPTIFESLAVAIIEQLVTGFEARASVRRLWRIAGEVVPGTQLFAAPSASAVRRVPMWKMHEIGIGAKRAAALHGAAARGEAIERLRGLDPPVVMQKLESLRGVGPWTSNAVARNALAWSDAVPVGDFHGPFIVARALAGRDDLTLDDRDEADEVMLEALEPFRPHRARVALLLERNAIRNRNVPLPRVDAHRREPWRY
jgi:3-methyladenine DNA glycosylase/8-oxoguanine DNA glycosylase